MAMTAEEDFVRGPPVRSYLHIFGANQCRGSAPHIKLGGARKASAPLHVRYISPLYSASVPKMEMA
jgi:hypothetical protein